MMNQRTQVRETAMAEQIIRNSFDRARLVAYYRAVESERPGALFHDPYARRLAGERGEKLMQTYVRAKGEIGTIALRTRIYDEILLDTIEREQVDTVINLAAGLDTRPYRLSLPASLRWIEVDQPAILRYKQELLAHEQPACMLERMPLDITDDEARQSFLADVGKQARQAFVLVEGLLLYLRTEQVAAIARDLYKQATIHWLLTVFVPELVLKRDKAYWNSIATEDVQDQFAPGDSAAFFKDNGWEIAEFQSVIEAALRVKAPIRFRWLLRLLARITPDKPGAGGQQMGFVLLKRASAQPPQEK